MLVLVSYDVSTIDRAGRRRLRHVAKTCLNYGIRVQNSVFECNVDPAQWTALRARLLDIFEPNADSLRFYFLGKNYKSRIEHHGAKPTVDVEEPLIL
ncbi:MAG: CRISPR-associated endonuclease Cas2 [Kiritimatiellia bacterium]|mgnify:CR=1 FL=1|jgi:CRISPR-associated protein Cas2